jgi:hypothetical protein
MTDVAEENIEPLDHISRFSMEGFFKQADLLPMYFSKAEMVTKRLGDGVKHVRGRLIGSPEMQHEYPEDDAVGHNWITQYGTEDSNEID